LRCGTAESIDEAQRSHANRSLRVFRNAERGTMTITVELPLETGELLEKALDRARDTTVSNTPECVDECWSTLQADALVAISNAYLSGNGEPAACTSDNYLVTVHVDRSALVNGDGRSSLPIESVKRLCCDGDAIVIVENEDGDPLSVGRKTRTVPTAIKRALQARDKACVFPGCHHKRFVEPAEKRVSITCCCCVRITISWCMKGAFVSSVTTSTAGFSNAPMDVPCRAAVIGHRTGSMKVSTILATTSTIFPI